ncbi:sodium ABC transporter ATP-binding protein [Streptococcus bovimastitidis]|uniref:Sodium ABC transporter ATP-binding protein n=1 Tax=Streptococcus bovimastitidis TaxID=1856638 RepID=A0A1L8MMI5_9STRE|nr:ABC transporter ATP-binding protein [Streptococcus bovimastitidis]OJF71984.1 sodium ABC transporter ATP-binding protein [Streptococcus bovimastitidis]
MLTINHLSKAYGNTPVLKDLSFDIQSGSICGFVGKNGAGKTTFFHSLLHFVTYQGQICLDGETITKKAYPKIGYLPEERSLMPKLSVLQQVSYLARLKGMTDVEVKKELPLWMERLEVKGKPSDKIKSLSKGNQQKIQLIITLIHKPDLIILDEPFSGLDPVNSAILKKVIFAEKERGATIIFSDHVMTNVEELCDQLIMIQDGQIVLNGSISDIRNSFGKTRLYLSSEVAIDCLNDIPEILEIKKTNQGQWRLILANEEVGKEIFNRVSAGRYLSTFDQQAPSIDDIFKLKSGALS